MSYIYIYVCIIYMCVYCSCVCGIAPQASTYLCRRCDWVARWNCASGSHWSFSSCPSSIEGQNWGVSGVDWLAVIHVQPVEGIQYICLISYSIITSYCCKTKHYHFTMGSGGEELIITVGHDPRPSSSCSRSGYFYECYVRFQRPEYISNFPDFSCS